MNEKELTTLLERSSGGLSPDVDGMVAGGAARGRRSLRRRRIGAGFGAAAALGAIALTASVLPAGPDGPVTVTEPGFASGTSDPADSQRELADPDVIEDRLIDALPDGEVTNVEVDASDEGVSFNLQFEGAAVGGWVDDTSPQDPADVPAPGPKPDDCDESQVPRDAGTVEGLRKTAERMENDPEFRACVDWAVHKDNYECANDPECWAERRWDSNPCRSDQAVRKECTETADGSWLWSGSQPLHGAGGPDYPAEWVESFARLYTSDHWEIEISALNTPAEKEGPTVSKDPVLSEDQLSQITTSEIWFA